MIRIRSLPSRTIATLAAGAAIATLAAGAAIATLAAGAALATLAAAPAIAAPAPAFPLSFIEITRNGVPVKVTKFQFQKAPVSCREGQTTYGTSRPLPSMKVRDRKFSGTFKRNGTTIRIAGKFKRSLKAATGTLKITGKVDGYNNCRSGKLPWKAGHA